MLYFFTRLAGVGRHPAGRGWIPASAGMTELFSHIGGIVLRMYF
jgi:hypothetical protein